MMLAIAPSLEKLFSGAGGLWQRIQSCGFSAGPSSLPSELSNKRRSIHSLIKLFKRGCSDQENYAGWFCAMCRKEYPVCTNDDFFFHSRTTAEELVAALQLRRFLRVNSSNFRIKNSPQLARSDVSICI